MLKNHLPPPQTNERKKIPHKPYQSIEGLASPELHLEISIFFMPPPPFFLYPESCYPRKQIINIKPYMKMSFLLKKGHIRWKSHQFVFKILKRKKYWFIFPSKLFYKSSLNLLKLIRNLLELIETYKNIWETY